MSKTSKKQRRLIEEEEKALKKISELQDYVKELREARKKEEDVEILRTLRSLKLGAWDLYNLLTGIQEGTVIMEARPPAPDQEDISEDAGDSALDKDGEDPAGWSGETSLDGPAERTEEDAGESGRRSNGIRLLHSPDLHTRVVSFNHDSYPERFQRLLDGIPDLDSQPLLHLQPSGVILDHTGNLAQSCNRSVGDISHMGLSYEGQHVVLAHGVQFDIPHKDHLLVFFLKKGRPDNLYAVVSIPLSKELKGLCDPLRCLLKSLPIRILANQGKDFSHMRSYLFRHLSVVEFTFLVSHV